VYQNIMIFFLSLV